VTPKPVAVFSSGGPLPAVRPGAGRRLAEAPIEVFGSTETGGVAWPQVRGRRRLVDAVSLPHRHRIGHRALTLRSPFLADDAPWEMDDGIA
jgi:hypothetical protein